MFHRFGLLTLSILSAVLFSSIFALVWSGHGEIPRARLDMTMQECTDFALKQTDHKSDDLLFLRDVSVYCYERIRWQGLLIDFESSRIKLDDQRQANFVFLWMVVAITLSGVAMAGLQLLASYRLAQLGREKFADSGEIAIEQGKISLRSSVTGLFILFISLAFFVIYVRYVYTIEVIDLDKNSDPAQINDARSSSNVVPTGGQIRPSVGEEQQLQ